MLPGTPSLSHAPCHPAWRQTESSYLASFSGSFRVRPGVWVCNNSAPHSLGPYLKAITTHTPSFILFSRSNNSHPRVVAPPPWGPSGPLSLSLDSPGPYHWSPGPLGSWPLYSDSGCLSPSPYYPGFHFLSPGSLGTYLLPPCYPGPHSLSQDSLGHYPRSSSFLGSYPIPGPRVPGVMYPVPGFTGLGP